MRRLESGRSGLRPPVSTIPKVADPVIPPFSYSRCANLVLGSSLGSNVLWLTARSLLGEKKVVVLLIRAGTHDKRGWEGQQVGRNVPFLGGQITPCAFHT